MIRTSIALLVLALVAGACSDRADSTTTVAVTTVAPTTAPGETTTSASPTPTVATTTAPPTATTTTEPPPTTTTTEEPDDGVASIIVEIAAGEVVGGVRTLEADRGSNVEITVVADVTDEVHVHAYDVFGDVAPGEPLKITFTADIPGVFEVELEKSHVLLLELRVS